MKDEFFFFSPLKYSITHENRGLLAEKNCSYTLHCFNNVNNYTKHSTSCYGNNTIYISCYILDKHASKTIALIFNSSYNRVPHKITD